MTRTFKLVILVTVLLFNGCTVEEPTPDFSGLQNISYSFKELNSVNSETGVALYPNPFIEQVTVNVSTPSAEVAIIYFSDEKRKYSKKIMLPEGNRTSVEVIFSGMPKGIYLCEVHTAGKVSRYRLIKAR